MRVNNVSYRVHGSSTNKGIAMQIVLLTYKLIQGKLDTIIGNVM